MNQIELELPKELVDRLREVARKRGVPVTDLLRQIIEKAIKEIEKN